MTSGLLNLSEIRSGASDFHQLYGGEVTIRFDGAKHCYEVKDRGKVLRPNPVSVTRVVGVLDKSGPLMWWAVGCACDAVSKQWRPGVAYDEIQISRAIEDARRNFRNVKQAAADIGTLAHDWIEKYMREILHIRMKREGHALLGHPASKAPWAGEPPPLPVNEPARNCIQAAVAWITEEQIEPIMVERRVYSRQYGFVGTFDGVFRSRRRKSIFAADWKSSKGIYPEFHFQTAAYRMAMREEGLTVDERCLIHLGKEDGAFEPVWIDEADPEAEAKDEAVFLACLAAWRRLQELEPPKRRY